jgi:branched-chain amino acid transport system permease protein
MLTVQLGIPIVVALPLGVIAAGLIGFLIALPCARLSPTSIAMLTFVLAYTIFELLNFSFTDGIFVPVSLEPSQSYYISLFLCIMGLALILYAPFSRIYARQQDKTGQRSQLRSGSSRTLGVRCLSFAIAGSIAGLSGCIHAIHWQLISPSHASIHESLTTLSVFAIGGIHSAFGPVLGAVAVVGLREFLVSFPNIWQIAIGAAVIVIIMYYPKGLSGIFETFFGGKHPTVDRKK